MAFLTNFIQRLKPTNAFLGLEITDSYIKIAELLTVHGTRPVLTKAVMERLPPDTIEDGRIKNSLVLHHMLQTLIKMNDFQTNKVHLVIPSSTTMVRYLKLPNVPDRALKKVIEFEVKHNIHLPFEQPYFDFVNLSADEMPEVQRLAKQAAAKQTASKGKPSKEPDLARKEAAVAHVASVDTLFKDLDNSNSGDDETIEAPQADVLLVAAPKELVDEYTSILRQCGLKPMSAEIKALSLFRLIQTAEPQLAQSTILTVDLNEASADISIFHEGHLKITRNVIVNFPARKPEKKEFPPEDMLFAEFVDPDADFLNACADLAHELERLMNFYRYTLNNRSQEFANTILTGDLERLGDISHYLADRLNQNIIVPGTSWLDKRIQHMPGTVPKLAIPIGLGLRGAER